MKTIIAIFLLAAAPAYGRIGETEQQIETRFGQPVGPLVNDGVNISRTYHFGVYRVDIIFEKGISQLETFKKLDGSAFAENEIHELLQADNGGLQWGPPEILTGSLRWSSSDQHSRKAYYMQRDRWMFISSQDFMDRAADAHAKLAEAQR